MNFRRMWNGSNGRKVYLKIPVFTDNVGDKQDKYYWTKYKKDRQVQCRSFIIMIINVEKSISAALK